MALQGCMTSLNVDGGEPAQAAVGLELQLPCQASTWLISGLSVSDLELYRQ